MKFVFKALHWLVCLFIPAVLAACYGAPYGSREGAFAFLIDGRVKDGQSGAPIEGIQVTCMIGDPGPAELTDSSGYFAIGSNEPCESLLVEDIDGAENGGPYQTKSVELEGGENDILIEMDEQS